MGEVKSSLKKDIQQGIIKYPSLALDYQDGKPIVKGTFPAHKKSFVIEVYQIMIGFPPNYPYYMPWVIETSGKIPRILERHVFSDNTLCFGNQIDLLRQCQKGITFPWFLDHVLNDHLCREYAREREGFYRYGERSHERQEGNWQAYYEIFRINDKQKILFELELVLKNTSYSKNKNCYCGSQKKYKRCHEKIELFVLDIGRNNLKKIYDLLKHDFETRQK